MSDADDLLTDTLRMADESLATPKRVEPRRVPPRLHTAHEGAAPAQESTAMENTSMASGNVTPLGVTPESGLGRCLPLLTNIRRKANAENANWTADCHICEGIRPGKGRGTVNIEYKRRTGFKGYGSELTIVMNCLGCAHTIEPSVENPQGWFYKPYLEPYGFTLSQLLEENEANMELAVNPFAGEAGEIAEPSDLGLSHDLVAEMHKRLLDMPEALDYLHKRGLNDEWISKAMLGYRAAAYGFGRQPEAIVFPVLHRNGEIANLIQRALNKPFRINGKDQRYLTLAGPKIELYPRLLDPRKAWALVCEGPIDVLNCRQRKIPAITSTHGTTWDDSWYARFKRKQRVYVAYDGDKLKTSAKRVEGFRAAGIDAVLVDLTRTNLEPTEDLSDYLVTYGNTAEDLRQFLRSERKRARKAGR